MALSLIKIPIFCYPSDMKAAVYQGQRAIELEERPKPTIGPEDVLLQIKTVGICGTDLHIYNGGTDVKPGTIIGHEFSADIVGIGASVTRVNVGDRVVAEHVITCHQCYYCLHGKPELCLKAEVLGMDHPGALAEYMAIPASLVYPIPASISYEEAALIEPLTIALYAASQARTLTGQRVAVVGQGPIGILLDQVLQAAGAHVIGIDAQPTRLEFVTQHGWVHEALNPTTKDFPQQLSTIAEMGVDAAFEAVGKESTAELCIDITRRDGDIFLLGVFEQPAKLNLMSVIKKELNIYGSWTCAFSFPAAIDLVAEGKIDLKSLITHRYSIEEVGKAFAEASVYSNRRIKTIINF